ncbi:MAG: glucose-methanol-choline oxidoreductase, partial [Bryobacterales bacterium]|nr:glucose-methanol-choline oxidoreductase [Bryobacterales bacterium]
AFAGERDLASEEIVSDILAFDRSFLIAFTEAAVFDTVIDQVGARAVDRFDQYLSEAPKAIVDRIVLGVLLMPPFILERPWFISLPLHQRAAVLADIFAEYVNEVPGDLIDTAMILSSIKGLLSGCYMELQDVWDRLDYNPRRTPFRDRLPGQPVLPPSGTAGRPLRTPVGQYLHDHIRHANDLPEDMGTFDYCIIGSGAGGAAACHALLAGSPAGQPRPRVIMLESGALHTNEAFPDRLLDAVTKLYFNSGGTLSIDGRTTFRQGHCVGGSATVNNAICLRPNVSWTQRIRSQWPVSDARWAALEASYNALGPILNVQPTEDYVLSDATKLVQSGFGTSPRLEQVPVNVLDCVGCGLCNLGCSYDAHRAPLITLIPQAIALGAVVVQQARATGLVFEYSTKDQSVEAVVCRTPSGRRVVVRARRFILAAGCIASSQLLMRSGFRGADPFETTVGQRFSCNFGNALFGQYTQPQFGSQGFQAGFVYNIPEEGTIIETAFAPPTALGLYAPQLGPQFQELASNFNHIGAVAVTVSSNNNNRIELPYFGQDQIDFKLDADDWARMARGMTVAARALSDAGAVRIYDTRFSGQFLRLSGTGSAEDHRKIEAHYRHLDERTYLKIETGHLQGGNVINPDPCRGVVDEWNKAHGVTNLWICDASVFPSPITLNLQYTVMALAHSAALALAAT